MNEEREEKLYRLLGPIVRTYLAIMWRGCTQERDSDRKGYYEIMETQREIGIKGLQTTKKR